MEDAESLQGFYKRKFDWMPDDLGKGIGHFNILRLDPFVGKNARPIPYKRRNFYKDMLVIGGGRVHYADQVVEVKKQALSFSNPLIPYKWEHTDAIKSGVYCIFDRKFLEGYGNIDQYSVFQPKGQHIFELQDEQVDEVAEVYKRMFAEINSEYPYKYDLLRNLVLELVHYAMKMHPVKELDKKDVNASQRITSLFLELLERQFPIDEDHKQLQIRSASDFAKQLNVHVNHLNRAVKEITQKTTSQLIAERIIMESRILVSQSRWDISEIAFALDFKEATHFSNFFKKHVGMSPSRYREARA